MNINDMVEVELTELGKEIFISYHRDYFKYYLDQMKGDKLKIQLWCLFETFGPHIHMGSKPCFINNEIKILENK